MSDLDTIRSKFEALRPVMDERMRRLWAGAEAQALGWGGIACVAEATGLCRATIQRGIEELAQLGPAEAVYRIRCPGGGAKPVEVKDPGILAALERLIEYDVAGDPMG